VLHGLFPNGKSRAARTKKNIQKSSRNFVYLNIIAYELAKKKRSSEQNRYYWAVPIVQQGLKICHRDN